MTLGPSHEGEVDNIFTKKET